ncbi:saccharopine dehydrogenase-like oxidoreductase [Myriangium duriaei CBS 260.36]|uniref:Saccharopine dehydrogenase-like oxidoreductase n=1 Tax=Myriangium duriaei CBS 260.36 TaxID=1168546 RepID=A0A9P4J4J1_9PEZI|nr:saccharopine dehydrogenase-like oxidoreductase [Myriangium duriaei CBS 260.36]
MTSIPFKSILILGAGELGIEVVRAISNKQAVRKKHVSLTVALRPTASSASKDASAIEALGCSIIRHDIATLDNTELRRILGSYDAVVSCLGFAAGPGVQIKITRAALAARIKRFFPWQFGVDYDAIGRNSGQTLFDEQLDVRELLRAQNDVDWVIVSTGVFMSFVFEDYFGVVEGAKDHTIGSRPTVRALGSWDNGLSVTAVEDIGSLTAAILFDTTVKQQIVYTSGDTFTYAELAKVVGDCLQKPVDEELWTLEQLEADLNKDPEDTIKKYRVAFAHARGVSWEKARTYNEQSKIPVSDLAHWIRQNIVQEKAA